MYGKKLGRSLYIWHVLILMLASGLGTGSAIGGARGGPKIRQTWEQFGQENQRLYKKIAESDASGKSVRSQFARDLTRFRDQNSSEFSCQFPYRAQLFEKANLGKAKPCPIKPMVTVDSYDTGLVGQDRFLASLDPTRIKRVFVNKTSGDVDHSFLTIELCDRAPANCARPLALTVHYGPDNVQMFTKLGKKWVTPLSDLQSSTRFRKREIDQVELNCNETCKERLAGGLYERINQPLKYSKVRRNCANFILDVVQLSTGNQSQPWGYVTPENVLRIAENQSSTRRERLETFSTKGDRLIRAISKNDKNFKTKSIDHYYKLPPEKRYCHSKSEQNGIIGFMNRFQNAQTNMEFISKTLHDAKDCSLDLSANCQRIHESAVAILNQIARCVELEQHVLLGHKLDFVHGLIEKPSERIKKAQAVARSMMDDARTFINDVTFPSRSKENSEVSSDLVDKQFDSFDKRVAKTRRELRQAYDEELQKASDVESIATLFDDLKARAQQNLAICAKFRCRKNCG